MREMVGCWRCGFVVRSDSIEEASKCWECGGVMRPISLQQAKWAVRARKRSAENNRIRVAAAEVRGLTQNPEHHANANRSEEFGTQRSGDTAAGQFG